MSKGAIMDTTAIGGCAPEAAICARGITRDFEAGQTTIRVLHGIATDIRSGAMTFVVGEGPIAHRTDLVNNFGGCQIAAEPHGASQAKPAAHGAADL